MIKISKMTMTFLFVSSLLLVSLASAIPGDIFVEFYGSKVSWANQEFTGHAFLCIVLHMNSGIKEDCYGFYPKEGASGFIGGPSVTVSEFRKNPGRFSRIDTTEKVKITEVQRRQILEIINSWNGKNYSLTDKNCIDFVHEAIGKTELKRPDRSRFQTPAGYMQELARLNPF
jgi:hypothetical protein